SSPKIHNCIVWGNGANSVYNSGKAPTYKYSLVEGLVLSGNGNLNGTLSTNNPLFVDADNADIKKRNYQLQVVSPCINSASLDLYDKNLWGNKDINGNSRAMYLMDMGAYEHQALAYPDANSRIYVNKTKRGLGNSWETAFTELADALAIAEKMNAIKENTITEIWVAEGTYKPLYKITNGETDREKAFVLINNVRLYGGFDGTETTLNERKWKNNPTILSGDIGMPNDNSDNCYHVVIAAGNLKDIHLDGFTITGGNANSDSSTSYDFKRIEHNRGGGIYNSKCQYLIINTIITENTASEGGGMYNYSSNPNLTRVTFSNNTAENGGGMCNFSSNPQLINILISSNTARYNGGGMYNYSSSPFLTNATVVNNNSRSGIYNHESSNPEIANSIIALSRSNPVSNSLNSTPIYKYSFVEGITEADEEDAEVKNYNIPGTLNPKFIDPDNGNYTLREDSPCKDSGNYDLYFNSLFKGYVIDLEELAYKDINGNEREVGTTIDMGAYEYQGYTWQSSKKAITLHPRLHPQDELFIHCDDNDNWEINTQGENYEWLNISSENGTGTTKIEFSINEVKSPRERKKVVLLLQNTTTTDLSPIEITIICEPLVIWYVKSNGTTTANNASAATSWDAACNDLQAVINTAAEGDEIWVAAGTYFPTLKAAEVDEKEKATTDRDKAFVLKKNVKIYGGFLGTEATLNERSWESNKTVLSGDIGTEGDISDNCYHVVISAGDVGDACLDGFTITGGNANMNTLSSFTMVNDLKFQRSHGGGIFMVSSSPALTHLTITGNTSVSNGGGIRCKDSSSRLNQVVISENVSTGGNGGGAFSATSWLSLTNVVVRGNRAGTSGSGGGIYSSADSLLIMTNVFITGNTAGYCGGGMYNNFSSPTLTNVTICGNTANSESGGIYNLSSSPLIRNSIIWGNTGSNYFNVFNNPNSSPSYRYSILEGEALSGNGNLDGTVTANAPLFVDAENGDFRLKKGSPGIDAGSDSLYDISMYGDKDLNGKQRFIYTIDMGAYENQIPKLDSKGIIYVNKNKTGEGNSWSKPMTELADALYAAEVLNAEKANTVKEIWVAAGTYYPTIKAAEIDTKGKATTNRDNAFVLLKNVKIYGGFTGTESSIEDRDWINNPTILSGDRGVVGDNTDNCFHVVISHDDVGTALLDGFTITDGNANGYQSISVNTGIIFQGDGGGMYNYASSP
ncbi:hypothetical protein LJB92_04305, partial [Bacteroidales bacterium OttesenSCG-928-M06]|nr:hypothetical protein [Bacteroidales bacterium OttesenSCG-928-M06]